MTEAESKNAKASTRRKKINEKFLIIALIVTTAIGLCACGNPAAPEDSVKTYKGLNGEEITDLAQYGAERIMAAEGIMGEARTIALDIATPDGLAECHIYVIAIGGSVWVYEYAINEDGTTDDTWVKQELEW